MKKVKSTQKENQKKIYKRTFDDNDYGPTGSQLEWMRRNERTYIDFNRNPAFGLPDFEY